MSSLDIFLQPLLFGLDSEQLFDLTTSPVLANLTQCLRSDLQCIRRFLTGRRKGTIELMEKGRVLLFPQILVKTESFSVIPNALPVPVGHDLPRV